MQQLTAEAIVLDVIDLHDYDRIVVFLSRWNGKKRGVAQGARRKFSRFAGQLQPLSKVRITWREKEGRELVRISSAEIIRAAEPLQSDLEGLLLSAYLRDHVMEFAQEEEPDDHLFRLLDSTVSALLDGVDKSLASRYFETWVLRLAGVFPAPWRCPQCDSLLGDVGAVLPPHGDGLVCANCSGSGGLRVGNETLEFLLQVGRHDLATLAKTRPSEEILNKVEQLCAQVRRRFLQHELKSYAVIRETLDDLGPSRRVGLAIED
ncbi:MAG: DNA repair protein RecO [Acidobacteriota bacterium]